jgi:hypothetical protein
MVPLLPSKHKSLNSIPSTAKIIAIIIIQINFTFHIRCWDLREKKSLSVFFGNWDLPVDCLMDGVASQWKIPSLPSPLPPPPPGKISSLLFSNRVSTEASGASSWNCISVCVSKLSQLSGHVESCSSAFHEKLKSCPDLMEGKGWGNLGELSYCWSGRW